MYTLHCTHVKSHLTLTKKSRLLWPVMLDDSAPIDERRKLVKTYKNGLWLLKYAGRPTPRNDKKSWSRKRVIDVKCTLQNIRGMLRERERERKRKVAG